MNNFTPINLKIQTKWANSLKNITKLTKRKEIANYSDIAKEIKSIVKNLPLLGPFLNSVVFFFWICKDSLYYINESLFFKYM